MISNMVHASAPWGIGLGNITPNIIKTTPKINNPRLLPTEIASSNPLNGSGSIYTKKYDII